MKAEIISIGDEILIGEIINNNAAFIGARLTEISVDVLFHTVVGDHIDRMVQAIETAWERVDLILMTGGLGPTHDDMTKDALCRFFKTDYDYHPEIVDEVRKRFEQRGKTMPENVKNQGLIPIGASLFRNEIGSAFGICFEKDGKMLVATPGVPMEMKQMLTQTILPAIRKNVQQQHISIRKIKTFKLFESQLVTIFENLEKVRELVTVAILPKATGVQLRLTSMDRSKEIADQKLEEAFALTLENLNPYIVALDDQDLEHSVASLLIEKNATVATAESCTGGLVAHCLTNIPGSSRFMLGGAVTYDNSVKTQFADVPNELIQRYGAVSSQVAEAMAKGIRARLNADYGIATTGIAGPDGGSPEKPVGLVYVAVADRENVRSEKHIYLTDREMNKTRFAYAAMNLLRETLCE